MFNIIFLLMDAIQLQLVGFAGTPDNPYFSAFMVVVIIIIIIAAAIAYRKDMQEKTVSK